MCTCVHVCVHVCVYMCTCVHVYMCTCVHVWVLHCLIRSSKSSTHFPNSFCLKLFLSDCRDVLPFSGLFMPSKVGEVTVAGGGGLALWVWFSSAIKSAFLSFSVSNWSTMSPNLTSSRSEGENIQCLYAYIGTP